MSLPNPLPDNPLRWDGWKLYSSPNLYDRLGLSVESNASNDQIEDHCRQLLVWWQKKLPLKNQPSNPLAQILRAGLDEAPIYLVEARTGLLDPERRREVDRELRVQIVKDAVSEFHKLIVFALVDQQLTAEAEGRLINAGLTSGLSREEAQGAIDAQLEHLGATRAAPAPPTPAPPPAPAAEAREAVAPAAESDPFTEFRRVLRLSKLCLDGDDMSDDQRDAMCNMGESLGLTGGEAEDVIDEYLEQAASQPMRAAGPAVAVPPVRRTAPAKTMQKAGASPSARLPSPASPAAPRNTMVISPAARAQERDRFPNFQTGVGGEMYLVTTGVFRMGANGAGAQTNEKPVTPTTVTRFHMGRFPITNVQYESFDPEHIAKRAPWADGNHPVVYVNALDAERFCEWLSRLDKKRYRLPTEAEWEYAARGLDGRTFPWGERLDAGYYANFADARSSFAWREALIDDGFAETAPVGSFSRGASPFGIEDLAGNVCEWCFDGFETYRGSSILNPRGPRPSPRRIYRGGSWKSRATSLRASARAFNAPEYSSNDVGFRIICECP